MLCLGFEPGLLIGRRRRIHWAMAAADFVLHIGYLRPASNPTTITLFFRPSKVDVFKPAEILTYVCVSLL